MATLNEGIWHITHWELALRMIMAVVLGGLIGIEREWSNHAAGFRTHILVCLGSATIMLLSIYGFSEFVYELNVRVDPARLAAQVISGIGFLGAGAILRNGNMIKGLTTAASVWVVAAIGLCVGAGFLTGALFCTLMVLISLFLLNKWDKVLVKKRRFQEIEVRITDHPGALGMLATVLGDHGVQIAAVKMNPEGTEEAEHPITSIRFSLKIQEPDSWIKALEQIAAMDEVIFIDAHNLQTFKNSKKDQSVTL